MDRPHEYETELLKRLLKRAEGEPQADHLDHESIVLFAHNGLAAGERDLVIAHLADCADCRRLASDLVKLEYEDTVSQAPPATIPLTRSEPSTTAGRYAILALAACLLVAVTIGLYRATGPAGPGALAEQQVYDASRRLLASSEFSAAREKITAAEQAGTTSDRLKSLDAQAAREMPTTVALSEAGRLTDFGVDVTGAIGRGPNSDRLTKGLQAADESLAGIGDRDVDALLNRGHVALSANRTAEALTDFEKAVKLAPRESLAWLGRGLAQFLTDDLTSAERDFRQAAELSPSVVAPRFNLAITLQELGRKADAVAEWQQLLKLPLSDGERQQVEHALSLLRTP